MKEGRSQIRLGWLLRIRSSEPGGEVLSVAGAGGLALGVVQGTCCARTRGSGLRPSACGHRNEDVEAGGRRVVHDTASCRTACGNRWCSRYH